MNHPSSSRLHGRVNPSLVPTKIAAKVTLLGASYQKLPFRVWLNNTFPDLQPWLRLDLPCLLLRVSLLSNGREECRDVLRKLREVGGF